MRHLLSGYDIRKDYPVQTYVSRHLPEEMVVYAGRQTIKFGICEVTLKFQDNCPMCHEKLYRIDATSQTEFQQDLPENQNVNVVQNNEGANVNADNNNQQNEIEE